MKDSLSWSPFRFRLLVVVVIPVLAALVTWATGYVYIAYGFGGFPAPWAILVFQLCPLGIACPLTGCTCNASKIVGVNIDWFSLGVDILFYTAIGYSLVLIYSWARPARPFLATTDPPVKQSRTS